MLVCNSNYFYSLSDIRTPTDFYAAINNESYCSILVYNNMLIFVVTEIKMIELMMNG